MFEDSIGAYIGYLVNGVPKRKSLYYEFKEQAQAELEDGSWAKRVQENANV